MDAVQVIDQAVFRFRNRAPEWTFGSGLFLNGLAALFRAAGNEEYRRAALAFFEKSVDPEGVILPAPGCAMDWAACGRALFFALEETGDERYRRALDAVASRVKASPLPDDPAGLYAVLPFLAEYDTRFGDKQTYKAIAAQFRAVHQARFDPEKGLYCLENGLFSIRDEGLMLLALTDTAEKLDMQLYEHYRALADIFLNAVRLPFRLGADRLFALPGGDADTPDSSGCFMILCALLKGVRIGLLDEEKYLPPALRLYRALSAREAEQAREAGVCLLVQAEAKEAGL